MFKTVERPDAPAAIRVDIGAIFVSLELSRSTWLLTSVSPGAGEKISQHATPAGDLRRLFECLAELERKARARAGKSYPIIVIEEAGLDGFWIHRALEKEGVESHVVDAASIAVPRRRRRAKTDRIDGKTLLRTLMAFKRGEPRVCAMAKPPSVEEEDRRRLGRERKTLIAERVEHVNRIKGLLFTQGAVDYQPLRRDRRARLEALRTGLGRHRNSETASRAQCRWLRDQSDPIPDWHQRRRHHHRGRGYPWRRCQRRGADRGHRRTRWHFDFRGRMAAGTRQGGGQLR